MDPRAELAAMLRPAGGGLYVVSTGRAAQLAVQRQLYGVDGRGGRSRRVRRARSIASRRAKAVILGVPIRRRRRLPPRREPRPAGDPRRRCSRADRRLPRLDRPPRRSSTSATSSWSRSSSHDDMLAPRADRRESRAALYGATPASRRCRCRRSRSRSARSTACFALNPTHRPDRARRRSLGRVAGRRRRSPRHRQRSLGHRPARRAHRSARRAARHQVLLRDVELPRERAARPRRPARAGRRARVAPRPRALGERRSACASSGPTRSRAIPTRALDGVIAHLAASSASTSVYFSNDIDGTDATWAEATGTPEPDGLDPGLRGRADRAARQASSGSARRTASRSRRRSGRRRRRRDTTVALAARYVRACLDRMI